MCCSIQISSKYLYGTPNIKRLILLKKRVLRIHPIIPTKNQGFSNDETLAFDHRNLKMRKNVNQPCSDTNCNIAVLLNSN